MQANADFGRRAFIRPRVGRAGVKTRSSIVVTLDNFSCRSPIPGDRATNHSSV